MNVGKNESEGESWEITSLPGESESESEITSLAGESEPRKRICRSPHPSMMFGFFYSFLSIEIEEKHLHFDNDHKINH